MEIMVGNNIKHFRRSMGVSQEKLAEAVGVTVQAVSKWENCTSLPDISIVPEIADFFGVTLDELFFGSNEINLKKPVHSEEFKTPESFDIPFDDKLYIFMVRGGKILNRQEWEEKKRIHIDMKDSNNLTIEIMGNADIKGDINGSLNAQGSVNCGNVSGGVDTNGGVNCGNISGGVDANGGVVCGNISGGVDANGGVVCENISGGIDVTGNVQCADISGNIECDGDICCESIKNSDKISCNAIYVKGEVNCREINGEVYVEDNIKFDF